MDLARHGEALAAATLRTDRGRAVGGRDFGSGATDKEVPSCIGRATRFRSAVDRGPSQRNAIPRIGDRLSSIVFPAPAAREDR